MKTALSLSMGIALLCFISSGMPNPACGCEVMTDADVARKTELPKDIEGREGAIQKTPLGLKTLPGNNFYFHGGKVRDFAGRLAALFFKRGPKKIAELNQRFTRKMGDLGMDFLVKDKVTKMYTKRVEVPVHSAVLPVSQSFFKSMEQSTKSFMQGTRLVLQAYYWRSGESSGRQMIKDINTLLAERQTRGEDGKPLQVPASFEAEMEQIFQYLKKSNRNLPGIGGEKFRDYPFLAGPTGFDAVIKNTDHFTGEHFEANLQSASGKANAAMLARVLKDVDPVQFELIKDRLPLDTTYSNTKTVLDAAGKVTAGEGGISVIVGPGEFSGASPDISMQAVFMGIPEVRAGDLYIGKGGYVYLDRGPGKTHPKVTTILPRVDAESLLRDGLSGVKDAIPVYQDFVDNVKIAEELDRSGKQKGLVGKLKPNVWYEYEYKNGDWTTGEITGVKMDKFGNPQLLYGQRYILPKPGETGNSGTLRDAVNDGKVYISSIGGGLVDSKTMYPLLQKLGKVFNPNGIVAGPPATLERSEWKKEFLRDWDSDKFVVKEAEGSGGSGVYIFANETRAKRQEIKDRIEAALEGRTNEEFEIQYFTESGTITSVRIKDGEYIYTNFVVDIRHYTDFHPDGSVSLGSFGTLCRVAPWSSAKANTSSGGGYVLLVPLLSEKWAHPVERTIPQYQTAEFMGYATETVFREYLRGAAAIAQKLEAGSLSRDSAVLKKFYYISKAVMAITGPELSVMRARAKQYEQGEISLEQLQADFLPEYNKIVENVRSQNQSFFVNAEALGIAQNQLFSAIAGSRDFNPDLPSQKVLIDPLEVIEDQ